MVLQLSSFPCLLGEETVTPCRGRGSPLQTSELRMSHLACRTSTGDGQSLTLLEPRRLRRQAHKKNLRQSPPAATGLGHDQNHLQQEPRWPEFSRGCPHLQSPSSSMRSKCCATVLVRPNRYVLRVGCGKLVKRQGLDPLRESSHRPVRCGASLRSRAQAKESCRWRWTLPASIHKPVQKLLGLSTV